MIGKLNRRIVIQAPSKAYNKGVQAETWSDEVTLWANVKEINSNEYENKAQYQAGTHYEISIRYKIVAPENRILFDSEIYNIFGVIHDEKRIYTKLLAKKKI